MGPTWWRNQWAVSNRLVSWSSGGSPASMFEAHATAEVYRECIYVIESWNCSIHVARKASYSRSTESWFYDTSNIFQLSMGQNDQPWSIQKNGWFNPGLIETTTHRMVSVAPKSDEIVAISAGLNARDSLFACSMLFLALMLDGRMPQMVHV